MKVVSKKDRYRERVGAKKRERERESERKRERERSISIYWFYPGTLAETWIRSAADATQTSMPI